jgi:hypothetical protein
MINAAGFDGGRKILMRAVTGLSYPPSANLFAVQSAFILVQENSKL